MRTIDKIITPVNGGMGRRSFGKKPTDGTKVYDCFVPMNGDYDRGGAYWGYNCHKSGFMRVAYTKDLSYVEFYRTNTR
jgi:hypothetical protein